MTDDSEIYYKSEITFFAAIYEKYLFCGIILMIFH